MIDGSNHRFERAVVSLAHELRTPLSVVVGYSELLEQRDDEATRRSALPRLREAAERLSVLLDDLLMAAALATGGVVLERQRVDLGDALAAAATRSGAPGPIRVADLNGAHPLVAWADPAQLAFVLDRLVREVSARCPDDAAVVLAARRNGRSLIVSVGGAGHAPPTELTDRELGLRAAQELVELHGGSLDADPVAGGFGFSLPLAAETQGVSARRLLIVDDDDWIRELLRATFPHDWYEIHEAADGVQALAAVDGCPPDLVLLDWRMPGAGGAGALEELKRRHPGLPVIVLTADGNVRPKAEAGALGADAFLTKPFSPLALLEAVEALLPG